MLFCQDLAAFGDVLRAWDYLLGDDVGCKRAIMNLCSAMVLVRRRWGKRLGLRVRGKCAPIDLSPSAPPRTCAASC